MHAAIETLAKIAARSAGLDPDRSWSAQVKDTIPFDGPAWQHAQFIALAEAAYHILTAPPFPEELS
jgi:hypothetical protein